METSGTQIRAARALLNWSAQRLATEAGVSLSTVQRLEAEQTDPMPIVKKAIMAALEAHGVEWVEGGARLVAK